MNKETLALGVALVAVLLAIGAYFQPHTAVTTTVPTPGGVSNYDTLYLGGTTGFPTTLSVASTSPSILGDIDVDSTGTTTIFVASSASLKGGCLQLENSSGVLTRAYVGAAGNAFIVEAGSCK